MKPLKVAAIFFAFAALATTAHAERVQTDIVDLTGMSSFGSAQLVVRTSNTGIKGCENGIYLDPSHPGFETNKAIVITSYTMKARMRFTIYTEKRWGGSQAYNHCEAEAYIAFDSYNN